MIQYEKSILPKLLAKENITVQHGNYKTAWFDIKDRVLGLPLWKDMGKDVYDLLIGHEVGHALETPFEGWHDSPEKLKGCPRSYINVIEDARIERKVKNRYPGLVASFNRGYKKLFDQEFFGDLSTVDWDQVKLIDKINLKAKIGNLLDVPFTSEEQVFMDRAMTTNTFEEVTQLVKDILAWTKENQEDLMQQPEPIDQDMESTDPNQESEDPTSNMGHDDYESDEKEEEEQETGQSGNTPSDEEDDESEADNPVAANNPEHQEDISLTDEVFRKMEHTLLDEEDGYQPLVIQDMPKSTIEESVVDFKDLMESRQGVINGTSYYKEHTDEWDKEFASYLAGVKKSVNYAVKEFEQKKAAYRYTRASVAKTGNLDVGKLWSYKTNDDIFLRSTKLADAKNHGMMLLIDFSGSMSGSMKYVMDQVIHTVMFCKGVNIPFEVYGFTTFNTWRYDTEDSRFANLPKGHIDMDNLSMPLLTSSSLKKKDFMESIKWLYYRTRSMGYYDHAPLAPCEDYGSTPLNQALMVSHSLVKKFKAKNNVEKMNFITFTDGEANRLNIYGRPETKTSGVTFILNGKRATSKSTSSVEVTKTLLGSLKKLYATNNIGFFMADSNSDWKWRVQNTFWDKNGSAYFDDYKAEITKEYRKNKCVEVKEVFGYDTYYLVKGGSQLSAQVEDFAVDEDASDAQIRNAFKKHSKNKKTNKVIMTKFGAAVA